MIYSSWDIEQNILKLVKIGHFLPFYPLQNPKIKILKNEKNCWRYHFTHVYQKLQSYAIMYGLWDVPCDRQFALLPNHGPRKSKCCIILQMFTINNSHMIYVFFSDMGCNRQKFLSFWIVFCRFISLTTLKIKILKNLKNPLGDIILLHDHKLYCSLDMAHNGWNCFSFWAIFCPFTPPTARKIKNFKKWKKKKTPGDIIILQ